MKKDKISANTLIFLNEILNQGVWSELNKLMKLKTNGSKLIETKGNLKKGISALYAYIDFLTENENKVASRVNSSDRIYVSQDNWKSAIVDEFLKFDSRGSEYITTVSECFIKTMALINASQKPHNRDTAYYRGQVDSSWNLQSSIGRKIASNKIPKNRNTVSKFELDSLRKWQNQTGVDFLVQVPYQDKVLQWQNSQFHE